MGKSRIFLLLLLSFILGVGVASFIVPISAFVLFTLLIGLLAVLVTGFRNPKLRLIGFLGIGFILGLERYFISNPVINPNHISFYNGQKVSFIGVVNAEVDVRKNHQNLTIKAAKIKKPTEQKVAEGKILINTALYPEYHYGDQLQLECFLEKPTLIEDFAYDQYLARFGIYSVCYRPKIEILASSQGLTVLARLYQLKNDFLRKINQTLPEPQASFLAGLLLGVKKGIPEEIMEDFSRTGTTHIVAISGYNITIIGVLMLALCINVGISRKKSFYLVLMALLFFVLVTGAQSSVVRAAVMGGLLLIAKQLGRLSRITNALVLAATLMLLINPKILIFDAGFQLSFLATMGLVYLSPLIEKLFKWLPEYFQIRESFLATMSATIFTLPLILYQFGRLSIVAAIVNILILPVIPLAMGTGFLAGLLSFIWEPLGQIFGWIVWLLLAYIIKVVEIFSGFPFASVDFSSISWIILVFGYSLLLAVIIFWKKQNRSQDTGTVSN